MIVVNSSDEEPTRARVEASHPGARFTQSRARLLPHDARNVGARQARAPLLVFTDPDCVATDDWLARLVERADAGERAVAGAVVPDTRGRGRSGRGVRVQVPRGPAGRAAGAPVRPDRQPARRAHGVRPRQRLPARAVLRRRRAVRRSPQDRCPRRLRAGGRGPARLRRRPRVVPPRAARARRRLRPRSAGARGMVDPADCGPGARDPARRHPGDGGNAPRSRAPPAFGSARAAPRRCSRASSRGSRARRRDTPAQSVCRLRPSNLRTPDGDVLDAVPGLQGLVRRRAGDPRAAARGRAYRGRRGRGDPGRQHLLRHARGGVEVASGRGARRPVGADGLRDRMCLEPRRRVRGRRPERRRHAPDRRRGGRVRRRRRRRDRLRQRGAPARTRPRVREDPGRVLVLVRVLRDPARARRDAEPDGGRRPRRDPPARRPGSSRGRPHRREPRVLPRPGGGIHASPGSSARREPHPGSSGCGSPRSRSTTSTTSWSAR